MAKQYVDNKRFLELILEYKKTGGRIPDEVGEILILISERLSTRYNFNQYTYKDEMVADGILRAVEVFDKFDPSKSDNPFSYFTRVIYRSFVQRIKKEKTERSLKDKLIMVNDIYATQEGDEHLITKDQVIGDFTFNAGD